MGFKEKRQQFLEKREAKKEEKLAKKNEILDKVDLKNLTKPSYGASEVGTKKMKDFTPWAKWKNSIVGLAAILVFVLLWWLLTTYISPELQSTLSTPQYVFQAFIDGCRNGILWNHISTSLSRILIGYFIALVCSIPVAFIMAWYKPIRSILDPFIQFLRCIPPIAYIPLIVAVMGTGENSKYLVIFIAVFLTQTVTIYQGIRNVDLTLVKAAYTFGARDRNLFTGVIIPSAFPFILTAMRLGVGAAMTTLIAAELTGARYGLGVLIQSQASQLNFSWALMGVVLLGIFGIVFDKVLLFIEKRLTRWQ